MKSDELTIVMADSLLKIVTWQPTFYWVDKILSWNPCNPWGRRPVIKRQAVTFEKAIYIYMDLLDERLR